MDDLSAPAVLVHRAFIPTVRAHPPFLEAPLRIWATDAAPEPQLERTNASSERP
jgi:hypothetical protein